MPAAEVVIDEALVRRLIVAQHPDLAARSPVLVAHGWDNVLYRLGDDLVARLPRRGAAAALVEHEQRWLPELAPRLPLPVPTPVRAGTPAFGYPWRWSVCPWLIGQPAGLAPPVDGAEAARTLGGFLAALHVPAPSDAPANPYRGGPLMERSRAVAERLARLASEIDAPAAWDRWSALVAVPRHPGAARWLHGDLHPLNLLVTEGRIAAVLDFGDLTAGDPATDLSVAWMLFDRDDRNRLRAAAGEVDEATWARARGWALHLSLAYLADSDADSPMRPIGARTLRAVLADRD